MICRRDLVADLTLTAAWCDLAWPVTRAMGLRGVAAPLVEGGMGMTALAPPGLGRALVRETEATAADCLWLLGYDPVPIGQRTRHGELWHLTPGPRSAHDRLRALRYFPERGMALPGRTAGA